MPFSFPNLEGSLVDFISSIRYSAKMLSKIVEKFFVQDNFLSWSSQAGGNNFGVGVTISNFQMSGYSP